MIGIDELIWSDAFLQDSLVFDGEFRELSFLLFVGYEGRKDCEVLIPRGARKMLQHYTTLQEFSPIDWEHHANICSNRVLGFQCLAVHPPLWGQYSSAGYENRNSAINTRGGIQKEGGNAKHRT